MTALANASFPALASVNSVSFTSCPGLKWIHGFPFVTIITDFYMVRVLACLAVSVFRYRLWQHIARSAHVSLWNHLGICIC